METAPAYQWKSKHILVVEDDESSAFILGDMLKNTGAVIEFTTDGQEAVDFIKAHPETDLILMDIHLPGMDGFTASRLIKAIAKHVVIIAQTAYAYSLDYKEAAKAGCDAFLTKPINPSLLLEKINSYLA